MLSNCLPAELQDLGTAKLQGKLYSGFDNHIIRVTNLNQEFIVRTFAKISTEMKLAQTVPVLAIDILIVHQILNTG